MNPKIPVLSHHESDYDRVMKQRCYEIPRWIPPLLKVFGLATIVVLAIWLCVAIWNSTFNLPRVWFRYHGPDIRGEIVQVEIDGKITKAEDLSMQQKKAILKKPYEMEYWHPTDKLK